MITDENHRELAKELLCWLKIENYDEWLESKFINLKTGIDGSDYIYFNNNLGDRAAICILTEEIIDSPKELNKLFASRIKTWRERAMLTQQQMSDELGIPKRTIENWEAGSREPAPWAERLVIEKLQNMTSEKYENDLLKELPKLKSDEEGRRPVGVWAVIHSIKERDEFIYLYLCPNMDSAIQAGIDRKRSNYNPDIDNLEVAYIAVNQSEEGVPQAVFYTDSNYEVYDEYDSFYL